MRILTWNLKHGRAVPSAGRNLFDEFSAAIAGWEWDVALLQEVPPWWAEPLAQHSAARQRHVLTSRNAGLAVRRAIATRWPDLIKSNGGGCNAILVRSGTIHAHRTCRLSLLPERRWVHAVRLDDRWVANLHLQGSLAQAQAAAAVTTRWTGEIPLILGGDFNLRSLSLTGFSWAGGHDVDQVFVRGEHAPAQTTVLEAGVLSDHAPVLVTMD